MKCLYAMFGVGLVSVFLTPAANAEVYKCIDATGGIVYSERVEAKAQCSPVTAPINIVPASRAAAPSPKSSESERGVKQDPLREQITEQERALAEAKKALAEQETIRLGGEQNYQRVLDRLKPYQDKIAEIEKKLSQLREEQTKAK